VKPTIPPLTGELWQQAHDHPELLEPYLTGSGDLASWAVRQLFADWDRLDSQYKTLQARIKGDE
jgi:hypothetical protein